MRLAPIVAVYLLIIPFARANSSTGGHLSLAADLAVDQCPSPTTDPLRQLVFRQCPAHLSVVEARAGPSDTNSTLTPLNGPDADSRPIADPTTAPPSSTVITESITTDSGSGTSLPGVTAEAEGDGDSPLDAPHFQSFEDWKKENLEKSGQSGSHVESRRPEYGAARKRPGANLNALDTLGEDSEIDIDFVGFGSGPAAQETIIATQRSTPGSDSSLGEGSLIKGRVRPQDAGKTCKERFNYASFDCAANILKTNSKCKSSSSILVESKDSYMRNECQTSNKFFIVELCDLIFVDTIVLANYEFFSSTFRAFTVSVSDRYPIKAEGWKRLGTFEARNTRDVQAFLVEDPLIWARYLRVELHTHYGAEYYCPVSLFRVHGTTMVEEFRRENEAMVGDGIADDEDVQVVAAIPTIPAPSPVREAAVIHTALPTDEKADIPLGSTLTPSIPSSTIPSHDPGLMSSIETCASTLPFELTVSTCAIGANEEISITTTLATRATSISSTSEPVVHSSQHTEVLHSSVLAEVTSEGTSSIAINDYSTSSIAAPTVTVDAPSEMKTSFIAHKTAEKPIPVRAPIAYPPIPPGQMGTQESFFKTIHRRLQQLEANATLSLQYIEEQSRLLRDAFTKVEKRQMNKTTRFLDGLNHTVVKELSEFRSQYTHLWLTAVNELEQQREFSQTEISAISARLAVLADEVIVQKRWAVAQSCLVILAIMVSLFARSSDGQLLKSMLTKSRLRLPIDSPMMSPARRTHRHPMHDLRERIMGRWSYQGHRRHGSAPDMVSRADIDDQSSASEGEGRPTTRSVVTGLITPESEIAEPWFSGAEADGLVSVSQPDGRNDKRATKESYLRPSPYRSPPRTAKSRLTGSPLRFTELASDESGRDDFHKSPYDPNDGYFTPRDFYPSIPMQSMGSADSPDQEASPDEYGEPGSSDQEVVGRSDGHDSPEAPSPVERPKSANM